MVEVENVKTACGRGIALDLLQEGMELLQRTIETYPLHIQVSADCRFTVISFLKYHCL